MIRDCKEQVDIITQTLKKTMSSHNKIVVVESEKSPKICSTNWKEDLALKRNLQVLDRSEHTIVNRITVDQKILLRRFQTKLGRSKMSYARAMGNMEMQKKLRAKTTFVLNTNIGHNEAHDDTLNKLWYTGRKTYEERISADNFHKKKQIGAFTSIEDDTSVEVTPKKEEIPERALTAVNIRPHTAVTIASPYMSRRRGTCIEIRPKTQPEDLTETSPKPESGSPKPGEDDPDQASPEKKPRPQTAKASVLDEQGEFEVVKANKRRPSTAAAYIHTTTLHEIPKSAPSKPVSRPKNVSTSNNGIGSMFKNDDFEISLLDFQRFRVYSANYESRVRKYGERIVPLKADSAHSVDYYTAKLQDSVRNAKKTLEMEAATDATPEDIKRATGNLSIKNLTLKTVDERHRNKSNNVIDVY